MVRQKMKSITLMTKKIVDKKPSNEGSATIRPAVPENGNADVG